jgi:predicted TIM-barrel fold metal-dependent hydrolase
VRPSVIDIHAHLMPDGMERISQVMTDNGLVGMINLSGGSRSRRIAQTVKMNEANPRIINFYSPNWRERHISGFGLREAKRLAFAVTKLGFKGLKVSKTLGLYLTDQQGARIPADWPELDPLWRKAGELGVIVAIHTADPKAFWLPPTPENERYEELALHPNWSFSDPSFPSRDALLAERNRVIKKHPKTTFMCVHFANNPEEPKTVDKWLRTYPNMILDTAARVGEIGRHASTEMRRFFIRHQDRILFGTDMGLGGRGIMLGSSGATPPVFSDIKPFYEAHWRFFEGKGKEIDHPTPIQGRWKVDALNLPTSVLQKIYRDNAIRILKLDMKAMARTPTTSPGKPGPDINPATKSSDRSQQ